MKSIDLCWNRFWYKQSHTIQNTFENHILMLLVLNQEKITHTSTDVCVRYTTNPARNSILFGIIKSHSLCLFLPIFTQPDGDAYGLFGDESGQLPPSTHSLLPVHPPPPYLSPSTDTIILPSPSLFGSLFGIHNRTHTDPNLRVSISLVTQSTKQKEK